MGYKRIVYVDTFKAIGILLMVLLHVGIQETIDTYVHVFHMPMFFFISGYMFNGKTKTKDFILKKIKSLIIPYFGFCMFYYLLLLIFKGFTLEPLKNIFIYNSNNIPVSNGLWFLTSLFFTNLICFFITKIKSLPIKVLITIFLSIIGVTFYQKTGVLLPLSLQASFTGVGLFFVGYCVRKKLKLEEIPKKSLLIYLVVLLLVCLLTVPIAGYVAMRVNCYTNPILFYPSSLSCCLLLLLVSYKINKLNIFEKPLNIINMIGENSIIFLCLNEPVINAIRNITNKLKPDIFSCAMCYFVSICILCLMCKLYVALKNLKHKITK